MIGELAPLILLPAIGIGLTLVMRTRARPAVGVAVAASTVLATVQLARAALAAGASSSLVLRGPAGVEVVLVADGLAITMSVMSTIVVLAVALFAFAEERRDPERRHRAYWPLLFALLAGLHGLFLAGDLITAYLMLEVIALCGALLVTLRGDGGSLLAGTRYFYAELVASTTMLVGVAVVWSQTGTVAFDELGSALGDAPAAKVGLAVITIGLLLKAPLAPLHFWLPGAHTLAPSAVSPVLSAVMVKAAFVVLARLWFLSVPGTLPNGAAQLLGALGTVAVLWGSFSALRATGLKQLIAASTVAQIGLLFLLPPLVAAGAVDGWTGGIVLAVTHAFAKAALLMAAAVIVDSARRVGAPPADAIVGSGAAADVRDEPADATTRGEATWPVLDGLAGSASRRPVAMMAFGIAGLSIVGLPPTGGFVAKWYLLLGSVTSGQWWWVVVLVVGTLLTVGYLMRFVRPAFAPLPDDETPSRRDARDVVALALASSTIVLGLYPGPLLELVALGQPVGGG